jgi:hypothetical protein
MWGPQTSMLTTLVVAAAAMLPSAIRVVGNQSRWLAVAHRLRVAERSLRIPRDTGISCILFVLRLLSCSSHYSRLQARKQICKLAQLLQSATMALGSFPQLPSPPHVRTRKLARSNHTRTTNTTM